MNNKQSHVSASSAPESLLALSPLASVSLLLLALCCDAVTAFDTKGINESLPNSLRVSAFVLLACFTAPTFEPISHDKKQVFVGVLLVLVAFQGMHQVNEAMQFIDALFVYILGISMTCGIICVADAQADRLTSWPAGLLIYVGSRGLRSALTYTKNARDFSAGLDGHIRGYAYASFLISAPLAFGHSLILLSGFIIVLRRDWHVQVRRVGILSGACAVGVCVAISQQLDSLSLFSNGTNCLEPTLQECEASTRALKFSFSNGSFASLVFASVACFTMTTGPTQVTSMRRYVFVIIAVFVSWPCVTFDGPFAYVDYCYITGLVGILITSLEYTLLGPLVFLTTMAVELYFTSDLYGMKFLCTYLTHVTFLFTMLILIIYLSTLLTDDLMYLFGIREARCHKHLTVMCLTAMSSVNTALLFSTIALGANYNGRNTSASVVVMDGSKTTIKFIVDHALPFVLCTQMLRPLVKKRIHFPQMLTWIASQVILVIVYTVISSLLTVDAAFDRYSSMLNTPSTQLCLVAAIVAWFSFGLLLSTRE